jgi:hypothetical protein
MSYMRGGVGTSHLLNRALEQKSYSTDAQAVEVDVARTPATQYFTLNSKDRFQSAQTGNVTNQPWNNFRLQRPQNLMASFATRIVVSELNMPWLVPNINRYNNGDEAIDSNTIGISFNAQNTKESLLNAPIAFYTPQSFVTAWNNPNTTDALGNVTQNGGVFTLPYDANGTVYPELSYSPNTRQFTLTPGNPIPSDLFPAYLLAYEDETRFRNNTSIYKMLGFTWDQLNILQSVLNPGGGVITGQPTDFVYTQYVDIVSDKFNAYSTTRDGSSDNVTNRNLLCRAYIADEISFLYVSPGPFPGQTASLIHRQFKNPKAVMWNKEAVIDWLDISLLDEWGQLLPLPQYQQFDELREGAYPDFQLTLLASEN